MPIRLTGGEEPQKKEAMRARCRHRWHGRRRRCRPQQHVVGRVAVEQVERRLNRVHVPDLRGGLELVDVVVGQPDRPDLALALEVQEFPPWLRGEPGPRGFHYDAPGEGNATSRASKRHPTRARGPAPAVPLPSGIVRRHVLLGAAITALGGLLFGYDTGVISGALLFIGKDFPGLTSSVALVYFQRQVPETKNRSLQDIERDLDLPERHDDPHHRPVSRTRV